MARSTAEFGIVGQGIMGSVLAYTLVSHGRSVVVMDNETASTASRVSGGVMSPMSGKRFSVYPNADRILPVATSFYQKMAVDFQIPLIRSASTQWRFESDAESQWANPRLQHPVYHPFSIRFIAPGNENGIEFPYGGFSYNGSKIVNISAMLLEIALRMQKRGCQHVLNVDWDSVVLSDSEIQIGDIQVQNLIICDGISGIKNPLVTCTLAPTKGEFLTFYHPTWDFSGILKWAGVGIVALGNGRFRCGATYDRTFTSIIPTKKGYDWLSKQILSVVPIGFSVESITSGIRPNLQVFGSPTWGQHPQYPNVVWMNGLGSHGTMLSPWIAMQYYASL